MKIENQTSEEILNGVIEKHPYIPAVLERVAARVEVNKRAIAPYQAAVLYELVKERAPKRILEIGTALGYSAAIMAEAAPKAEIITLNPDVPEAEQAKQVLYNYYPNVAVAIQKSWDFLDAFDGEPFDFIFIDGDHKNVRLDLPWWEHLSEGGLFFFHDYSPEGTYRSCPPVYEAVNQFAASLDRKPDVIIIDDGQVGMAGFTKQAGDAWNTLELPVTLIEAAQRSHCSQNYLAEIYDLAQSVKRRVGDIVECGVTNGGSAAVLAMGASRTGRNIWLFDTFTSMPEPDPDIDGSKAYAKYSRGNWCASSGVESVLEFVSRTAPNVNPVAVKGEFEDTFVKYTGEKILILHIDATLYQSTADALALYYDQVVDGGLVIIGAYAHWPGVRRAVDEFRSDHDVISEMEPIDFKGRVWKK